MKLAAALELKNRTRGDAPVVVVVTGPGPGPAELEKRVLAAAEGRVEVLGAAAGDADKEVQAFLDDAGIDVVPAVLVYARGVLLERCSVVRDARAAQALLSVLPGMR
jgi:hypothetical protein